MINGCDTTSHLHSIKKKLPLKLLSTSGTFLKAAAEFNDTDNSKDSIIQAGETGVTQLYKTGFQGSLRANVCKNQAVGIVKVMIFFDFLIYCDCT